MERINYFDLVAHRSLWCVRYCLFASISCFLKTPSMPNLHKSELPLNQRVTKRTWHFVDVSWWKLDDGEDAEVGRLTAYWRWWNLSPREYWMVYRGPGFLAVIWFGSSPMHPSPTPVSKLDRRHTGRLMRDNWLPEKGKWVSEEPPNQTRPQRILAGHL